MDHNTIKNKKSAHLLPDVMRRIKRDKCAFTVFLILAVLVIGITVYCAITAAWENAFTGVLALLLLFLPVSLERGFRIQLPTVLEILAYVFVFCSAILGEIGNYYVLYPFWDSMLHVVNGFMFAAFGFCLVDIFNRTGRFRKTLSPFFLALVAFCFAMTIGVLWEFFECFADQFLGMDMQKDVFVDSLNTVSLPNDAGERITRLSDIAETTVRLADGTEITFEGYLDIGLLDTMKDLAVNFVGAVVFSVVGYFYVKHRGKGRIARQFIPVLEEEAAKRPANGDAGEKIPGGKDQV